MMNKSIVGCLIPLLFAACCIPALHAGNLDVMNEKVRLQFHMEERVKQMLGSFLNTRDIIAVVRIHLLQKAGPKKDQGGQVRAWDESVEMVLPGVPAATSMTRKTAVENKERDFNQMGISKIDVAVMVGKKISNEKKEMIRQLVSDAIDLDIQAGDTVSINSFEASGGFAGSLPVRELGALAVLGAFLAFLFGPFHGFLKTVAEYLARGGGTGPGKLSAGAAEEGQAAAGAELDARADYPGSVAASRVDAAPAGTAAFSVGSEGIEDLRLALEDEPPAVIAKVIQRLPSKTAFAAVPRGKLEAVILQFSNTVFEDPAMLQETIQRIKVKMEGISGGAGKLSRFLQIMDKPTRKQLLGVLEEKYPDFAADVDAKLFRFEDLLRYDDASLKRIFRKAGTEPFARCLKGCSPENARRFQSKLGESITTLLTNRMKTIIASGEDVDAEIAVMAAVETLSGKGFISPLDQVKQAS